MIQNKKSFLKLFIQPEGRKFQGQKVKQRTPRHLSLEDSGRFTLSGVGSQHGITGLTSAGSSYPLKETLPRGPALEEHPEFSEKVGQHSESRMALNNSRPSKKLTWETGSWLPDSTTTAKTNSWGPHPKEHDKSQLSAQKELTWKSLYSSDQKKKKI